MEFASRNRDEDQGYAAARLGRSSVGRNYVEPPESEGMPPVEVIDTPQGFKILSNLLPKPGSQRKLGNGDDSGN